MEIHELVIETKLLAAGSPGAARLFHKGTNMQRNARLILMLSALLAALLPALLTALLTALLFHFGLCCF